MSLKKDTLRQGVPISPPLPPFAGIPEDVHQSAVWTEDTRKGEYGEIGPLWGLLSQPSVDTEVALCFHFSAHVTRR